MVVPFVRRACRVAAGLAALCSAVSPAPAGTIRDDRDPAAYTALAASPQFDSVGLLEVDVFEGGQPAVGTATLIRPDWVMTAAHVVESGRAIRFTVGGQTYPAVRWVANQKYNGDLLRGYDIALVQLATPVAGVTPATLYRGKREFDQTGTFVGFGRTGTGLTGDVADDRVKRAGTNTIDGYLRRDKHDLLQVVQKLKSNYRTFAVDFDQPGNPAVNRIGDPTPTDLEFLISRGDSGGPTFVDDPTDGLGPLVAGIHSFGEIFDAEDDSSYGDVTGETRVRAYAKWVDKVTGSERYQGRLNFGVPTLPAAVTEAAPFLDPAARSLPPVAGVPEPGVALALGPVALFTLFRRQRRARSGE